MERKKHIQLKKRKEKREIQRTIQFNNVITFDNII